MMKMRGFVIALLTVVGGATTTIAPSVAGQDISREASTFVQSVDDKAMAITGKNLDAGDREQSFRDMFVTSFDVPGIGRFVLGRYWRTATDAQKSEFLTLFENMIVRTYSNRFTTYKDEQFTITGARADGDSAVVGSTFAQTNSPPVKVDWRVLKTQGTLKIVDVMVEGVSMSVTQQQEFGSVIQRGGGRIDGLLEIMRERAQPQNHAARN
ncbi:MAG TPA: ABC transporter substrate-binding protein [Candidatus Sulfotelmatobacter sp.]|nr:ABC transporter substrate-binding protein [Candidatus Sulfotelmatobacter sp.]